MAEMPECTGRRRAGVRSVHGEHVEEEASLAPHPKPIALGIGNVSHQWCRRCRLESGIALKIPGMEMQVTWSKLLQRTRVLLANIHRVRHLWQYWHPGNDMRLIAFDQKQFISLDQKPSWFNDADSKIKFAKEGGPQPGTQKHLSQPRERYTILTSVRSWGNDDTVNPPEVAILLRGRR